MLTTVYHLQNNTEEERKKKKRKRKELAEEEKLKSVIPPKKSSPKMKLDMLINALEVGNEEINESNNQQPKKKEAQLKKGKLNEQSVKNKREDNYVSNMAKEALERGGGKACLATHGGGCRHYGILDFRSMERNYFLYYSKEGGWLNKKAASHAEFVLQK